jgi:hypothetical protein
MKTFLSVHQNDIIGHLTTFDRMIFRGHLTGFYPKDAFAHFLGSQRILLKDFKWYVTTITGIIKNRAEQIAAARGHPVVYLDRAMTARRGKSKEDLAREIAERDGITEGLICVFSTLEACSSFGVKGNRASQKLEVVRSAGKCLHYYFYLIDREFGFMHVRLQSWFPFQIQLYINGREWLARQMDRRGIRYQRYENSFLQFERPTEVQQLCESFARRKWVRVLDAFARRANPILPLIRKAGFGGYWWVLDQAEIATDVMFRDRRRLEALLPGLLKHALTNFSAEDVMRFLGKRLHGNFQGQLTSDMKRRPEGYRVKHRVKGNSIKIYDKWSVLRVETTICWPREFKVLRLIKRPRRKATWQWRPMGKGVGNLPRYLQVGAQANRRYLEALAQVQQHGKAIRELDSLCQPVSKDGNRYAKLQPLSRSQREAFRVLMSAGHLIQGVRNREVREALYGCDDRRDQLEQRKLCARVSRMLRKLKGHGLISRVQHANLYRVTPRGHRIMSAVLAFHGEEFEEVNARAS